MADEKTVLKLTDVDRAREQMELFAPWAEDVDVSEITLRAMPEIDGAVFGYVRNNTLYPVSDKGGLYERTGLNKSMAVEFGEDDGLMTAMIAHALTKRVGDRVRVCGVSDRVVGIEEPVGQWLDPRDVFDIAREELNPIGVADIGFRRQHLHVQLVSDHFQDRPKKPGDVVHSGLSIQMNGQVMIGPYSHQMVCSNGMMQTKEELVSLSTREHNLRFVRDLCQAQVSRSRTQVRNLMRLDEVLVNQPEKVVARIAREFDLSNRFTRKLVEQIPELPAEPTMFDIFDLATRIARDGKRMKARMQTQLGDMMTVLSEQSVSRCSQCGSKVSEN